MVHLQYQMAEQMYLYEKTDEKLIILFHHLLYILVPKRQEKILNTNNKFPSTSYKMIFYDSPNPGNVIQKSPSTYFLNFS